MNDRAPGWAQRRGARLPFAALAGAAITGILLAQILSQGGMFWGIAVLALGGCLFRPRAALLLAGVVAAFAAVHAWSLTASPGKRLQEITAAHSGVWTIEGVVTDEPRPVGARGDRFRFTLRTESLRHETSDPIRFRGPVAVVWRGPRPAYGDRVAATGVFRALPIPRNPGEFDFAAWLRRRGVYLEFQSHIPDENNILAHNRGNPLKALALRSRGWISTTLHRGLEAYPVQAAVIHAMTLGDTSGMPDALNEAFRETGTLHIFSVSGLHVGMLGFLLWYGLKLFRLRGPPLIITVILLLFFYALITGLRPASVRAAFMASLVLGGLLLNRPPAPLNSLCAAAFLILLADTRQLFNPGFQLSFLVVTSILLLGAPLQMKIQVLGMPDAFLPRRLYHTMDKLRAGFVRNVCGLAAISTAAWIGSLPLMAVYFHIFSIVAIPVNLIAVPLAFVVLALAVTSLSVGWLSAWLSETFNLANLAVASLLIFTVENAARLPGAYAYLPSPAKWLSGHGATTIIVFDANRGAAALVLSGNRTALIDCGSGFVFSRIVRPALRAKGIARVDHLLLTHGDSAHVGGAPEAFASLRPGMVAVGPLRDRSPTLRRFTGGLAAAGIPKRILLPGHRIELSADTVLETLYPPPGISGTFADDKALVVLLRDGALRVLFMSDAGLATEDWLLRNAPESIRADIIVKGEHVSGFSGGPQFLRATGAKWLIRSWAPHPEYEQLDPQWLAMAEAAGVTVLSMRETGAVVIRSHGERYSIRPFLTGEHLEGKPSGSHEPNNHP